MVIAFFLLYFQQLVAKMYFFNSSITIAVLTAIGYQSIVEAGMIILVFMLIYYQRFLMP